MLSLFNKSKKETLKQYFCFLFKINRKKLKKKFKLKKKLSLFFHQFNIWKIEIDFLWKILQRSESDCVQGFSSASSFSCVFFLPKSYWSLGRLLFINVWNNDVGRTSCWFMASNAALFNRTAPPLCTFFGNGKTPCCVSAWIFEKIK